ncbi:metalloendopeptidase [Paraliobacillus quinghaiensis]|uniref:Metalloendopeptidase n=1 Tax=Paraliobacillus quinghaiensis TaxID=470815 RepID=A0A917TMH3_9BACI|nr:M23 family metallopeptidase [Paraliobacillus quinghaiensis]GGM28417.1 metalloendopeptidase [Paraliobacillus quinghaiensis]
MGKNEKLMHFGLLKKTALITTIGIGLTFNVAYADDDNIETVYHVYVDAEHIGTIDNKEVITSYVDNLIKEHAEENDTYSYVTEQEINYVPELVFNPKVANEKVLDKVEDDITIQVNAYALQIDDNVVGYFKDKETAEKTLQTYKEKYVDKETLQSLEEAEISLMSDETKSEDVEDESTQSLSVGDSIILDVELSENVSLEEQKVSKSNILTVDDGMKLLEKGTLEDKIHTVEAGDVLGSIAGQYELDMEQLLDINPDLTEDSILQIGQEINVTDYAPYVNVIVNEEKLVEEEIKYEREVQYSDAIYKGDSQVKQSGQEGKKEVQYALEIVNGKITSKEVIKEEVTKEPVKEIIVKGTKVVPHRGTGEFTWPTVGGYISSHMGPRWGSYHKGMDIAGPSNRAILAADNGTVESAGWHSGGYGYHIVINHNNGYKTTYSHLASISVRAGQTVPQGSKIGVMGTTGRSTGVHLHIEAYKNGQRINPAGLF